MDDEPSTLTGKVYLVGAGPGDPGLLTLKGRDCLARGDVVIYDYLANPALLDHVSPTAERIYAGKQAGRHTLSQSEINELLVGYARQGKTVVRLKGGDPFLFGRGSEEALAMREAGVPYEIVPGVTSALAVPAYAGIPLTHRGLASTVAIATGHEDAEKAESALDWRALAAADTLVLLMGVGNLPELVRSLRDAGRAGDTPIALVRWGTRAEQETVTATLDTIVSVLATRGRPFAAPAIIVVGKVVGLRERLRWFDADPLFGKRILVTRSREQASELSRLLQAAGAIPVELPALAVDPLPSATLDEALMHLDRYEWVVFTSTNGVRLVAERLRALDLPLDRLASRRIAVVGPATAREAERQGLADAYQPPTYDAETLASGLPATDGTRVLLALAEAAAPTLREQLELRGVRVEQVAVYRTAPGAADAAALRTALQGGLDAATFASSLTVQHFGELAQRAGYDSAAAALGDALIACIGPRTAARARELGLRVDVLPAEHTVAALVDALRRGFAAQEG